MSFPSYSECPHSWQTMLKSKYYTKFKYQKNEFTFCVQIDTTKVEREPKLKDIKKMFLRLKGKFWIQTQPDYF